MVVAHTDPQFAQTLLGPDGQPIPEEFPRPPGIYEGPICAATGKLPIPGFRTVTEVLVQGEGPTLRCNQITDAERRELTAALQDAARNSRFTSRGIQTLHAYAAAVGVDVPSPTPSPTPEPIETPVTEPTPAPNPTEPTDNPEPDQQQPDSEQPPDSGEAGGD